MTPTLLVLLGAGPTGAATVYWQDLVQGGVSVDGNGVSTPYDGTDAFYNAWEDFEIDMPATAEVTEVYVVLIAKWGGFYGDPASEAAVNGEDLSSATLVESATHTRVYSLDPEEFDITGAGSYPYQETGDAEYSFQSGYGIGGATLAVLWEDETIPVPRHVTLAVTDLYYVDNDTITGLPTDSGATGAVLSVGILWECSDEQNGRVWADGTLLSAYAGGRDDGATVATSCGVQDWNSLVTQGSFGADDDNVLIGSDGDDWDSEPAGGTSGNSRLSDELWYPGYADAGEMEIDYVESTGDGRLVSFAVVIEMRDTDADGIYDAIDDCPLDADPLQIDSDGDGEGDACDDCTDADGDGYGLEGASTKCAEDCDDTDASVYPGAPDAWYDGVDSDCAGDSDYDQDRDGHDWSRYGGDDCDDTDRSIHPGAFDPPYDGVDADCDGASDYDADGDGFDSASYGGDDCDDGDPDTYPGAPDDPYDGVVNDCDEADEYDADGDGHRAAEYGGDDCDDARSDVNPDEDEIWYDGIDQDCDGNDSDQDGDGWPLETDCDDTDASVYPGAPGWSEDCEPTDTAEPTDSDDGPDLPGADRWMGGGGCRCGAAGGRGAAGAWALLLGLALVRRRGAPKAGCSPRR